MLVQMHVPVVRPRAPYLESKDVVLHVRAGLVALMTLLLALGIAAIFKFYVPQAISAIEIQMATPAPDIGRAPDLKFSRGAVGYERMYAPNAETRSVEHMYAKPRPRDFTR